MKIKTFIRLATLMLALTPVATWAQPIFTDITRSAKERAEDIVKHMTLDEKVSLMIYNSPAVERLGIKNYNWWNEALHGVARNGNATVFPMPIAMASSFDTELLEQIFTAVRFALTAVRRERKSPLPHGVRDRKVTSKPFSAA